MLSKKDLRYFGVTNRNHLIKLTLKFTVAMGVTPIEKINRWIEAAGQTGKPDSVKKKVIAAGEFLEKTCRASEEQACASLTGIDFSSTVEVDNLQTPSVYVQYAKKHRGEWFTDTGLSTDRVGIVIGSRKRKLFTPSGTVPALKTKARDIRDYWTQDRIFDNLKPYQIGPIARYLKVSPEELLQIAIIGDRQDQESLIRKAIKKESKPILKKLLGTSTRGGGTQYLVFDKSRMNEIKRSR